MSLISKFKQKRDLKRELETCQAEFVGLTAKLEIIRENSGNGSLLDNLTQRIVQREKELKRLKIEFDSLKEWSDRLLEISKRESSDLVWYKFRYFNLLKDHQVTEWNLTGTQKSYEFAIKRFEQIRDENNVLKEKLRKLEQKEHSLAKS